MLRLLWVLWPSFVIAGVGEVVFFTVISPRELYLFGEPVKFSPMATYSIGFLCLWALCAASSAFTFFLQHTSEEVNHRGIAARPGAD